MGERLSFSSKTLSVTHSTSSSFEEVSKSTGASPVYSLSNLRNTQSLEGNDGIETIAAVFESLKPFSRSSRLLSKLSNGTSSSLFSMERMASASQMITNTKYPAVVNEIERLEVVKQLEISDTSRQAFDNLTALAAQLTDCPVSYISIVEEYQQVFPSHYGTELSETPKEHSFSAVAMLEDPKVVFVVTDTRLDPRFMSNPRVHGPDAVVFFAAVPLVTLDGIPIGALCVTDSEPRTLDSSQLNSMLLLGKQAMQEIELRCSLDRLNGQVQLTEKLLQNILPASIIERLMAKDRVNMDDVTDSFDCATILFADIVGFTKYAGSVTAQQLMKTISGLFTRFDLKVNECGVTKIKTIGDGYMAVGGIPVSAPDHAQRTVDFGFKILQAVKEHNMTHGSNFQIRIGINSGPVMAGVVGIQQFTYDCFGDAVNVANRMESHGTPGKIHISEATYDLIKNEYLCEKVLTPIEVKGKGKVQTYFVKKKENQLKHAI